MLISCHVYIVARRYDIRSLAHHAAKKYADALNKDYHTIAFPTTIQRLWNERSLDNEDFLKNVIIRMILNDLSLYWETPHFRFMMHNPDPGSRFFQDLFSQMGLHLDMADALSFTTNTHLTTTPPPPVCPDCQGAGTVKSIPLYARIHSWQFTCLACKRLYR